MTDHSRFQSWFEGSQAVDSDGKPLVLYYGGRSCASGPGEGVSTFSNERFVAEHQAEEAGTEVVPVNIKIERLLDARTREGSKVLLSIAASLPQLTISTDIETRDTGWFLECPQLEQLGFDPDYMPGLMYLAALRTALTDAGYDGVVFADSFENHLIETWIPVSRHQAQPTFDAGEPRRQEGQCLLPG